MIRAILILACMLLIPTSCEWTNHPSGPTDPSTSIIPPEMGDYYSIEDLTPSLPSTAIHCVPIDMNDSGDILVSHSGENTTGQYGRIHNGDFHAIQAGISLLSQSLTLGTDGSVGGMYYNSLGQQATFMWSNGNLTTLPQPSSTTRSWTLIRHGVGVALLSTAGQGGAVDQIGIFNSGAWTILSMSGPTRNFSKPWISETGDAVMGYVTGSTSVYRIMNPNTLTVSEPIPAANAELGIRLFPSGMTVTGFGRTQLGSDSMELTSGYVNFNGTQTFISDVNTEDIAIGASRSEFARAGIWKIERNPLKQTFYDLSEVSRSADGTPWFIFGAVAINGSNEILASGFRGHETQNRCVKLTPIRGAVPQKPILHSMVPDPHGVRFELTDLETIVGVSDLNVGCEPLDLNEQGTVLVSNFRKSFVSSRTGPAREVVAPSGASYFNLDVLDGRNRATGTFYRYSPPTGPGLTLPFIFGDSGPEEIPQAVNEDSAYQYSSSGQNIALFKRRSSDPTYYGSGRILMRTRNGLEDSVFPVNSENYLDHFGLIQVRPNGLALVPRLGSSPSGWLVDINATSLSPLPIPFYSPSRINDRGDIMYNLFMVALREGTQFREKPLPRVNQSAMQMRWSDLNNDRTAVGSMWFYDPDLRQNPPSRAVISTFDGTDFHSVDLSTLVIQPPGEHFLITDATRINNSGHILAHAHKDGALKKSCILLQPVAPSP